MDGWRCIKRIYFKSRSFWPIGFLTLRYNYIKVCLIQFVFTIHHRVELKFRKCLNIESSIIMSMIQWNTKKNSFTAALFCRVVFFHSFILCHNLSIKYFLISNFQFHLAVIFCFFLYVCLWFVLLAVIKYEFREYSNTVLYYTKVNNFQCSGQRFYINWHLSDNCLKCRLMCVSCFPYQKFHWISLFSFYILWSGT